MAQGLVAATLGSPCDVFIVSIYPFIYVNKRSVGWL